ncbi:MAG: PepSY domain-containing protein [Prochlorothrix sp.]|nr:PepSY domain-containing protein [Prochlorothrix sp.]
MANPRIVLRKTHRFLVPIASVPLLLTALTGVAYQAALLNNQGGDFYWLMAVHRGQFGPINLEAVYPFLNGISMLVLVGTGVLMWFGWPRRKPHPGQ